MTYSNEKGVEFIEKHLVPTQVLFGKMSGLAPEIEEEFAWLNSHIIGVK